MKNRSGSPRRFGRFLTAEEMLPFYHEAERAMDDTGGEEVGHQLLFRKGEHVPVSGILSDLAAEHSDPNEYLFRAFAHHASMPANDSAALDMGYDPERLPGNWRIADHDNWSNGEDAMFGTVSNTNQSHHITSFANPIFGLYHLVDFHNPELNDNLSRIIMPQRYFTHDQAHDWVDKVENIDPKLAGRMRSHIDEAKRRYDEFLNQQHAEGAHQMNRRKVKKRKFASFRPKARIPDRPETKKFDVERIHEAMRNPHSDFATQLAAWMEGDPWGESDIPRAAMRSYQPWMLHHIVSQNPDFGDSPVVTITQVGFSPDDSLHPHAHPHDDEMPAVLGGGPIRNNPRTPIRTTDGGIVKIFKNKGGKRKFNKAEQVAFVLKQIHQSLDAANYRGALESARKLVDHEGHPGLQSEVEKICYGRLLPAYTAIQMELPGDRTKLSGGNKASAMSTIDSILRVFKQPFKLDESLFVGDKKQKKTARLFRKPRKFARPVPVNEIHPELRFTRLGAVLRHHVQTGDHSDPAVAMADMAISGSPHDRPLDTTPLHVMRDFMMENPDHPLAQAFNWEKLPEKVELDRRLADSMHYMGINPNYLLYHLNGDPDYTNGKEKDFAEDFFSRYPWATGKDKKDSLSRIISRRNNGSMYRDPANWSVEVRDAIRRARNQVHVRGIIDRVRREIDEPNLENHESYEGSPHRYSRNLSGKNLDKIPDKRRKPRKFSDSDPLKTKRYGQDSLNLLTYDPSISDDLREMQGKLPRPKAIEKDEGKINPRKVAGRHRSRKEQIEHLEKERSASLSSNHRRHLAPIYNAQVNRLKEIESRRYSGEREAIDAAAKEATPENSRSHTHEPTGATINFTGFNHPWGGEVIWHVRHIDPRSSHAANLNSDEAMEAAESLPASSIEEQRNKERIIAKIRPHTTKGKMPRRKLSRKGKPRKLAGNSSLADALARQNSSTEEAHKQLVSGVLNKIDLKPHRVTSVLHDTVSDTRPGIVASILGQADPAKIDYAAAWHGLLTKTNSLLIFKKNPKGQDSLYRFHLPHKPEQVRTLLDKAGIASRILIPHNRGTQVMIHDPGRKLRDSIGSMATKNGVQNIDEMTGTGSIIGGRSGAEARKAFREITRQFESAS